MRFYVFSSVVIVFVLNLTLFLQLQLFILHSQLLRSAACRQFFPTFSGNGNIFFATHLTFLIRSSPLRPRGKHFNLTIFYFPVFPFLFCFLLCRVFFARFGSLRLDFFYIKSAICANVCLPRAVYVFVGRRFQFSVFFFSFSFPFSVFCFLFRGQVIEAQTSSRHPAYLSGESPLCLCVFLFAFHYFIAGFTYF